MDDPVLPQLAIDANAEVLSVEWLFEPLWPGVRMLVRRSHGRVILTDEHGEPIDPAGDTADAAETLADAILADEALVDGVWTAQPFVGDGSPARAWAETLAAEGLAADVPDPLETERRRAFVAIDLVELEGMPLHDVPFQERRRLLESVIDEGVRVRLSKVVKQPLAGWLVGWRANGFTRPPPCRLRRSTPTASPRCDASAPPTSWSGSRPSATPTPSATSCGPPRPAWSSTSPR
jgi:ATP-dependent DNA ligase